MTEVMVLGGAGMLGHKMFQVLGERFPETSCTIQGALSDGPCRTIELFQHGDVIENVNVMDFTALKAMLSVRQPGVVVNCVGIVKQRAESKAYVPSITVNALLPHRLAEICERWGGRVIHFSTDCVFSGKRGNYTEGDPSDAEDLYGKTKYLGEVATENAVTLRTSIIGRELFNYRSLLEWFLLQNHTRVNGYKRALYSGVTTNHLAEVVADIISEHPGLHGLYQVASQTISKYDLLCLLRDAYHLDIEVISDEHFVCDRSMTGDKFRQATCYVCPPWEELTAQLANDPTPYGNWR